jgi:hypothetical protein
VTRLSLSLATYLFVLAIPNPTRSCPVFPTAEALVDAGLSSIATPLEVACFDGSEGAYCHASLDLKVSTLASRHLVPEPSELAEQLVAVAQAFGAKTCEIRVWVIDDLDPEADRYAKDACRTGEFRYEGRSWWAVGDEQPCFSN